MAITSLGSAGNISLPPKPADTATPRVSAPAVPVTGAVSQQPPPSRQAVEDAVKAIKQSMATMSSSSLEFSIDGKQTVVRIVDSRTGDLIRQIPSQEVIDIAKAMDRAKGLLLRQEA